MLDPNILQLLLPYLSGGSNNSIGGLFNFKQPLQAQGSMPDEEYAKLKQSNTNLNQSVNQVTNGLANTQLNLYSNKDSFKTNPYAAGDILSKGLLGTAAQLPGTQGLIGQGLQFANMAFQKTVKEDKTALNNLNQTSAFTGAQQGQSSHLQKIQNFNNQGFLGQIFTKKSNRKKGLLEDQNAWKAMGQQAKTLQDSATKTRQNSLSIDTNNQRNALLENGFNYNLQFGKKGLVLEKAPKQEIFDRNSLNALTKESILEIYELNKNLFEKIKQLKQQLLEKQINFKKDGGKINLIVEGSLHAHKHEIKNTEEFKEAEITEKGVPVITKNAEGNIIQHQEVEAQEIILHLQLTKQMEAFAKEDTDESAISAGKILQTEILKNTKDKTKLIKSIE